MDYCDIEIAEIPKKLVHAAEIPKKWVHVAEIPKNGHINNHEIISIFFINSSDANMTPCKIS